MVALLVDIAVDSMLGATVGATVGANVLVLGAVDALRDGVGVLVLIVPSLVRRWVTNEPHLHF